VTQALGDLSKTHREVGRPLSQSYFSSGSESEDQYSRRVPATDENIGRHKNRFFEAKETSNACRLLPSVRLIIDTEDHFR
jgi:hypothetical protein